MVLLHLRHSVLWFYTLHYLPYHCFSTHLELIINIQHVRVRRFPQIRLFTDCRYAHRAHHCGARFHAQVTRQDRT